MRDVTVGQRGRLFDAGAHLEQGEQTGARQSAESDKSGDEHVAGLFHVASAVDADGFAGDEIAVEQREHRLRDLDLAAPPAERRRLLDRLRLVVGRARRRENRARRDGVDQDVVRRELQRERFGQRDRRRLRDVVRQIAVVARPSALRDPVAEVDDAAAALARACAARPRARRETPRADRR